MVAGLGSEVSAMAVMVSPSLASTGHGIAAIRSPAAGEWPLVVGLGDGSP